MPWKDPGSWDALANWFAAYAYAPLLAFAIAVVRGLHAGGKPMKTILEGAMIGLITLGIVPLLEYFKMPGDLSIFAGSFMAFVGVEWVRDRVDAFAARWIDRIK